MKRTGEERDERRTPPSTLSPLHLQHQQNFQNSPSLAKSPNAEANCRAELVCPYVVRGSPLDTGKANLTKNPLPFRSSRF